MSCVVLCCVVLCCVVSCCVCRVYELIFDRIVRVLSWGSQTPNLPLPGEAADTIKAHVPILESLVSGQGVKGSPIQYVRFQGLTFEMTAFQRPADDLGEFVFVLFCFWFGLVCFGLYVFVCLFGLFNLFLFFVVFILAVVSITNISPSKTLLSP